MKNRPRLLSTLPCLLAAGLFAAQGFAVCAFADAPLKGGVRVDDTRKTTQPSLNRQDLDNNKDPFSGDSEDAIDAPKQAFKAAPPKRANPLKGALQDQGQRPFMGTGQPPMVDTQQMPIDGIPDDLPPQQPPQMVQQPPMQAPNPNDPDSSPEMSLLWDAWHRRVAENIFQRFNFFAKAAFRRSPPLMSSVSYVVTRDGRIMNLQVQQKSPNVLFNVLVFQAVKSLDGDLSILQFPQGSRRQFVPKSGVFTQNYGGQEGFRHTTGDEERIRQQQVMR